MLRKCLVIFAVVFLLGCPKTDSETLSDSAASKIIQDTWQLPAYRILLNDFQVVSGGTDWSKRRVSVREFRLYKALGDAGLLIVAEGKNLTEKFTGWDDWFSLVDGGVQLEAAVLPTQRGKELGQIEKRGESELLALPDGKYRVNSIVQNEEIRGSADHYRLVMGTHTATLIPEIKKALDAIGSRTYAERKFRVLLKFDPFDKSWKLVANDIAPRQGEFNTESVNEYLLKQGVMPLLPR